MGDMRFEVPFRFLKRDIYDGNNLKESFRVYWDFGAAALKRGALTAHFAKLKEIDATKWEDIYKITSNFEEEMWNDDLHEDEVFARYLCYLDTNDDEDM